MTGGNIQNVTKRRTKNITHPSILNLREVFVLMFFPHSGHMISIGLKEKKVN